MNLIAAIAALSPVGYWKLDDAGTSFADSSANSNTGTGSNVASRGVAGPDGLDYVDLSGNSAGIITIPDQTIFSANAAPGLTMFALVHPNTLTSANIMSKFQNPYEWQFFQQSTGKIAFSTHQSDAASIRFLVPDAALITAGQWNAVAGGLTSGSTIADMDLYTGSGTPVAASYSAVPTGTTYSNTISPVTLGNRTGGSALDGGMAHAAIFAGKLSSENVGTLMAAAATDGWI